MLGICLNDAFVSVSRVAVLTEYKGKLSNEKRTAYIFLLFENVLDLEPDVGMCERIWRVAKNSVKAGKWIFKFTLLLINNA